MFARIQRVRLTGVLARGRRTGLVSFVSFVLDLTLGLLNHVYEITKKVVTVSQPSRVVGRFRRASANNILCRRARHEAQSTVARRRLVDWLFRNDTGLVSASCSDVPVRASNIRGHLSASQNFGVRRHSCLAVGFACALFRCACAAIVAETARL